MAPNQEPKDDTTQILIKGWETLQSLAKSNGESAWNLRAWGISVWSALLAYAYTSDKAGIVIVAMFSLLAVFFVELAIRQIQYQYIEKSLAIEKCINAVLVGDEPSIPDGGISTNIDTPTICGFCKLLILKRWLIWFPYLLLAVFSLLALRTF